MGLVQQLISENKHIDEVDVEINIGANIRSRPRLDRMSYDKDIKKNLKSMFYDNGPGNGLGLFLPFDQDIEHGMGHAFLWDGCANPNNIARLINSGRFSGYVLHPGNVDKFEGIFGKNVPLIYKIDGHINQPQAPGIPAIVGSVEDALENNASAIGMTIYPGSEKIKEDLEAKAEIIRQAHKCGLPAVVWAYARGPGLNQNFKFKDKDGEFEGQTQADSLLWTSYAVRIAHSFLQADIIKTKYPKKVKPENRCTYDAYIDKIAEENEGFVGYKYLEPKHPDAGLSREAEIYRANFLVNCSPRAFVIFSGGPKLKGNALDVLKKQAEIVLDAGAEGAIYGRNIWGVPVEQGLEINKHLVEIMQREQYQR